MYGKLKGEDSHREHLIPCINVTKSGIDIKYAIQRLIREKERIGIMNGPAISDETGALLTLKELDATLHDILLELYEENISLFPPSVDSSEDVIEHYRCYRTFRRTSDTRALEEKVNASDIEIVNRWDQASTKQNKRVAQPNETSLRTV